MILRYLLVALALLSPTAAFAQAQQKSQQQAPAYDRWCRDQGLDHGMVQVCFSYTYEQCMASRAGNNDTTCYLNPRYDPRFRRG